MEKGVINTKGQAPLEIRYRRCLPCLRQGSLTGQAMVLVVTILAMLFVVITAFFVLSQAERTAALRHLDSLRAQYIAEAGVAYAQKVLNLDKLSNLIDCLEDLTFTIFEGTDADLDGDGNNESKAFNLVNKEGNTFGRFSVRVSDEASRFNLNASSAENLERLFSTVGIDTSKVGVILSRRPFNAKEEIGSLLGARDFALVKDFLTVYSRDLEIDVNKTKRIYLNSSQPRIILEAFLAAGIKDAYQKAANLKDASDADLAQTLLDKFSQPFSPSGLLEAGGWRKIDGFYEATGEDETPGKFIWSNLSVEDGEYFCFLYGPSSTDVVGGDPPLLSGEGLKEMVEVEAGSLTLTLKPAKDKTSRFSYIELVSLNSKQGLGRKITTGTEALVINELMAKPSKEILADTPGYLAPGDIQKWTFSNITAGDYYVLVQALKQGGLVGDVYILGKLGSNLRDHDYFPETVSVGSSRTLSLEIRNNSLEEASFKGIELLQEPDGEFIEIVNLSLQGINLDDFSVEVYTSQGEPVSGWPARIPKDTRIQPYQHLVLAVDSNDAASTPENLKTNRISFQGIHKISAVGLIFDEAIQTIDKDSDLLPNSGGRIILKDGRGERIDAVEYQSTQLRDFTSLERADPSSKGDGDGNGFFDSWYLSESEDLSTAALANENFGMYTLDEKGKLIKNNISQINVFNYSLSGLTKVEQLSSGENWKKFSVEDLARMADHFAYEVINLNLAGHEKEGGSDTAGIWEFVDIPSGNYLLSILTDDLNLEGDQIQVGIKTDATEEFTDFRPLLFDLGVAFYGTIEIPKTSSTLELKIIADSIETKSGLKQIQLEPVVSMPGRVNINTAKSQILRSLFISDSLVDRVLNNRPFGVKDSRILGVGEAFLLDAGFIPFYNSLTVKSDVYEISCRGDFLQQGKTLAYQTIRTVIERGD